MQKVGTPIIMVSTDRGIRMEGMCPIQYFYFLTLCLWVLHEKNRLQKAFIPLNIQRVAELLPLGEVGGQFMVYNTYLTSSCYGLKFKNHTSPSAIGDE